MSKGTIIKSLRDKSRLTQEQLADKLGTSKQTIFKYENDIITNIPSDKVELMAEIFNVSPAHIMGWDVQTNGSDSDSIPSLADPERQLLDNYRQLNPVGQRKASDYLDDLVASGRYAVSDNVSTFGDGPISIAAHARTDIEVTDEMREHDLAIMLDDDF